MTNKKELFAARGYKEEHVVQTDDVLSLSGKGKVIQIQNRTEGLIKTVTESSIMIEFKNVGPVAWTWEEFPHEHVIVTRGKEAKQDVFLERSSEYPITATPAYNAMICKASIIMAMKHMHERLHKCTRHTYPQVEADAGGVPLCLKLKPKKGVYSAGLIGKGRPLVLLPLTTSISIVNRQSPVFVKTFVEVGEESVLALNPVWHDPVQATKEKPAIVEYFWQVRRSDQEAQCNMQISYSQIALGSLVSMPNEMVVTHPCTENISLPFMISTKNIKANAEIRSVFL